VQKAGAAPATASLAPWPTANTRTCRSASFGCWTTSPTPSPSTCGTATANRKRFALRWRTKPAVRDVAHDVAWTAAASLDRIVPLGDLGHTIRAAVLFEFADWQRTNAGEEIVYPINHAIARMLDWFIQHQPERARAVVAEIVARPNAASTSRPRSPASPLRQALALDGKLPDDENPYDEFFDLALAPES
jgi:hypothetical protein